MRLTYYNCLFLNTEKPFELQRLPYLTWYVEEYDLFKSYEKTHKSNKKSPQESLAVIFLFFINNLLCFIQGNNGNIL